MPEVIAPGQAKLVKAGSEIVFQMHYTTNGTATMDRSKVGLIFAKEPPRERVMTVSVANHNFAIPAGEANHAVDSRLVMRDDVTLTALFPHMHLRGKDFEYGIPYPTGERETLRDVSVRMQRGASPSTL